MKLITQAVSSCSECAYFRGEPRLGAVNLCGHPDGPKRDLVVSFVQPIDVDCPFEDIPE